ncbi:prostaglandin G/H synthase 2-like, partial [Exaiptasia diaphana]|uniref:Uncharacterized protein n=1 Tax=Exaiptasia diaphana TaxID=2652724 RepID=A0A913XQR7_EXADI
MSLRLDIKRSGSLTNYFSNVVRSRFKWFWRFMGMFPWISDLSTIVLLRAMEKTIPRIPDQTTHHDYKTYDGLYDESRTVHALLLPKMSKAKTSKLPDVDEVKELFRRKEFKPEDHRQSSVFFPFWAQWFVHQFFNSSTEVPGTPQWQTGFNLSQLYGSFKHEQEMRTFDKGRIKTESVNGEEYPRTTENQFKGYKIAGHQAFMGDKVFDVPVMPFNALPGIMAIHTVMIRNHNRNAERLATAYPRMDDEEIFQKAKLISIAQVMKVTMEDYVNKHILASNVEIRFRPNLLKTRHWRYFKPASFMPSNSISSEFNFLYRWHQL